MKNPESTKRETWRFRLPEYVKDLEYKCFNNLFARRPELRKVWILILRHARTKDFDYTCVADQKLLRHLNDFVPIQKQHFSKILTKMYMVGLFDRAWVTWPMIGANHCANQYYAYFLNGNPPKRWIHKL